jgi:Na+-translocating ferredoxin:NAD+ oxidoreductase RnfA subunit
MLNLKGCSANDSRGAISAEKKISSLPACSGCPKGMKGVPLSLVIAGILALAFMGFTGIVK